MANANPKLRQPSITRKIPTQLGFLSSSSSLLPLPVLPLLLLVRTRGHRDDMKGLVLRDLVGPQHVKALQLRSYALQLMSHTDIGFYIEIPFWPLLKSL